MFKGKILSTYFPERYLNIFSSNHLSYYLTKFNFAIPALIQSNAVYKRKALIECKNQDPVMANWSVDLFATFLWSKYPGAPTNNNN